MTEAEYVEDLKRSAQNYLTALQSEQRHTPEIQATLAKWEPRRSSLSATTFISMADLWLKQGAAA
jgi:hypothetical protein